MRFLQIMAMVLAMAAAISCYSCPDDGHTFYHADVSTGCQVYHFCRNSEMTTMTCPSGQAFDHHTSQCADASTVHCVETGEHHLHKRSAVMVHSISISEMKESAREVYQTIKSTVKLALKETAPTVYQKVEEKYTPIIKDFKNDVMPIFNEKVLPRLAKLYNYSKILGDRILQKVQQSYELSNSTHINLVSFSDLITDISNHMEPVMQQGRYLSNRLAPPRRAKRSVSNEIVPANQVPEVLVSLMEPIFKNILSSMTDMFKGDENTIMSRLIIPVARDIWNDQESRFYLKRIHWAFKAAVAPLVYDMMKRQTFYTPEGTIIQIPKSKIDEYRSIYFNDMKPLLRILAVKHLPKFLRLCSQNVPLLFKTWDGLRSSSSDHIGVLSDSIVRFVRKHGRAFATSSNTHYNFYTITEIKDDFKPISITLLQMVLQYLSEMDNSWTSALFNKDSFIFQALLGQEQYARPSGNGYSKPLNPATNQIYRNTRRG